MDALLGPADGTSGPEKPCVSGKSANSTPKRNASLDKTDPSTQPCKKAKVEEVEETSAPTLSPAEIKALGVRQYLEKTVVPTLLQGMQELVKTRPEDPFETLAKYLQDHNPLKQKEEEDKQP